MHALAFASFLAFGALLVVFGANASDIIRDLKLDYADFGLLASTLSMGLGAGILGTGPLVDRLPRRPLFLAACGIVACAAFVVGPATSFPILVVASFSIGFGAGGYETILNTLIVEEAREKAPRTLLFIHSAATLGASLTPFAIGFLREPLSLDWYDSFHAIGLFHLLLLVGLPLLPKSTERPQLPESHDTPALSQPGASSIASDRLLLATICAATFVYVGVESALTFFVADYAESTLGLAASRASGVVGFFWGGLLIGRLTVGLAPFALSAKTTAFLALVSGAALATFALGGVMPPELSMAMTGFLLGGVFPIMIGLAGMVRSNATGSSVALAAGLGSIGGFCIPWLTGILASETSLRLALMSLSLWLCLLAAASHAVDRRQKS